ncbi:MAG: glycosyltransferase family 4 protein [Pseudorhodoplanes sp.]
MQEIATIGWPLLALAAAAVISAVLIVLLRPLLVRYAMARPNFRSSHREPTPQGGGMAVVAATLLVSAAILFAVFFPVAPGVTIVFAAVLLLAVVGAVDDIRALPASLRIVLHIAAVAAVLASLPAEMRVAPAVPFWVERALLLLAGVWIINLVNFMDGIDWMTVAEFVPVLAGVIAIGLLGGLPASAILVAFALLGALLGFAPFNRPVARLFLGDVGSLPLGLLLGWLLLLLAGNGHAAAAVILPLYYFADATITLVRRIARGERVWIAHRTHFYQRATENGHAVPQIVRMVFCLNLALVMLAIGSTFAASRTIQLALLALAGALVATLLIRFSRRTKTAA